MRKFLRPFFSRIIPGTVLLVLQIALLIMPVAGLYDTTVYVDAFIVVVSVVIILFEINRDTDSGYKLIWIAIIGIFPVFGVFLYIYVQSDVIMRYIRKNLGRFSGSINKASYEMGSLEEIKNVFPYEYGIFHYLASKAYAPCFFGDNIRYFPLGEDMYVSLLEDIKSAKKYIFLEYFILNENDSMWQNIYSVLKSKVKEGIEVRVIYDALGSLTCTSSDFADRLCEDGIKCYPFSPVKPFISTYHNNRDHRKIAIIDGKCAYTGGVNLADEYINSKVRFGHWKDTAVRIEGSGVNGFVLMYTRIWNLLTGSSSSFDDYIESSPGQGKGYSAPFDDTPMDSEYVTRDLYLYIINSAREYVYINTPYLILDDALCRALKFASGRGVDVRICMPHQPDKWYAFAVGRSYYPELIRAGVKIYEYTPGFLHAKSTLSDDCRAYIGSANYDFRSLYLHYECGVYMYGSDVIESMKEDFENTIASSVAITMVEYQQLGFFYRIIGRILRFFASLM